MNNSNLLANRFREVIFDGTFIANTNYKKELENLNWQDATEKIKDLNTIAILTQHIHYYIKGINQVLEGGNLEIRDSYSFDFPPIQSEEDWQVVLENFWADSENFYQNLMKISDEKLHQSFVEEKYGTFLRNMDAMIEHAYYHLGQIVLIKKLLH